MQLTRRDVMRMVYQGQRPPYVPWVFQFTHEAFCKLAEYYGSADRMPRDLLGGHVLTTGQGPGDFFEPLGQDLWRDGFGVVWDRSVDQDTRDLGLYNLMAGGWDAEDFLIVEPGQRIEASNGESVLRAARRVDTVPAEEARA